MTILRMPFRKQLRRFGGTFRKLKEETSGIALTEFAFVAPFMLFLGMSGIELTNLALTHMRIAQAAVHLSDNASRMGERDPLSSQRIYESDINDLLVGVNIQAGNQINLFEHGRVIVSSLERNSDDGQWIHWQRCRGLKNTVSKYGPAGTGQRGTGFPGMGKAGRELTAETGSAVMYVEISYDYQPLIGNGFVTFGFADNAITSESAFGVRGTRDLDRIYQRTPPATVSSCANFTE